MILIPWTEKGRRDLEARFPCPGCGQSIYLTATDTPYFFEHEMRSGQRGIECDNPACKTFVRLKKTKAGVEVVAS